MRTRYALKVPNSATTTAPNYVYTLCKTFVYNFKIPFSIPYMLYYIDLLMFCCKILKVMGEILVTHVFENSLNWPILFIIFTLIFSKHCNECLVSYRQYPWIEALCYIIINWVIFAMFFDIFFTLVYIVVHKTTNPFPIFS